MCGRVPGVEEVHAQHARLPAPGPRHRTLQPQLPAPGAHHYGRDRGLGLSSYGAASARLIVGGETRTGDWGYERQLEGHSTK